MMADRKQPPQRTAKYETLPLHRGKRRIPVDIIWFARRTLRQALSRPPRVRVGRGLALESTLDRALEHDGRQYGALATLVRGKRLVLPLRGRGRVSGNGRVVLGPGRESATVHVSYDGRVPARAAKGPVLGLGAGVTEVLASSTGGKYGQGCGALLKHLSAETAEIGKARAKLLQVTEKTEQRGDVPKASRLRRNNLGSKKLRVKRAQGEAAVKRVVGQAVRPALGGRPAVVAGEDLTHLRGRTKSRTLSRIVSRWARAALRERLEFQTQAGCSRPETVNVAQSSQSGPNPACRHVHTVTACIVGGMMTRTLSSP